MFIGLYNQLFIMSFVSGGLYLILKIINTATKRYFKASWHYYTYIVIYTFLLLPYHKLVSLFNFNPKIENILSLPSIASSANLPLNNRHDLVVMTDITVANASKIVSMIDINFFTYLLITGSMVFIIVILIQNIKIHRRIFGVCRLSDNLQFQDMLLKCKQKMGMSKNMSLYISPYASTPFLYGILRPRIVLPDIQFTAEELQHVFQHELTHWKRHDAWLKFLMLLINAIHWFNPLVYFARLDIDRFCELSCDESAVSSMNIEERRRYCELILGVLWNVTGHNVKLFSAFSDKRKQLERRMNMIMENKSSKSNKRVRILALSLTLALSLGGTMVAYAANSDGKEASIQLGSGEKVAVELYTDSELEQSENDLLDEAANAFDIDTKAWYVSNLEKIDTVLTENFNNDDYNSISQMIYEEYYNDEVDRQPNANILLSKELNAVMIISDDSNNNILCAKTMLDSMGVKDKSWDYQKEK